MIKDKEKIQKYQKGINLNPNILINNKSIDILLVALKLKAKLIKKIKISIIIKLNYSKDDQKIIKKLAHQNNSNKRTIIYRTKIKIFLIIHV